MERREILAIGGILVACFVVAVGAELVSAVVQRGPCKDCLKAKTARLRSVRTKVDNTGDDASA